MGNSSEFKRAVNLLKIQLNFEKNNTVQVFEASIRLVAVLMYFLKKYFIF